MRRAPWYRRTKLLLKRLAGREPWFVLDRRVALRSYGDVALRADDLRPGDIVYALGVGTSLAVELDLLATRGVQVHAFDPSPESVRWVRTQRLPPQLHFHALGVAECDGKLRMHARMSRGTDVPVMYSAVETLREGPSVVVECQCLATIMHRLRHSCLALLKIDVEGAEYGILDDMLKTGLRPAQLLVEFHHRFPGIGRERTVQAVRALRAAGYRLVFISDTGREFSFLRCD